MTDMAPDHSDDFAANEYRLAAARMIALAALAADNEKPPTLLLAGAPAVLGLPND